MLSFEFIHIAFEEVAAGGFIGLRIVSWLFAGLAGHIGSICYFTNG